MKLYTLLSLLLSMPLVLAQEAPPPGDSELPPIVEGSGELERPVIDVVFVLDTTGSMSGLIAGAKQKIWSIANAIATARRTPTIRIGLVAYRDRKDDYVTKKSALTTDLDAVYGDLMKLEAGGGGDRPESVNQALHEAVTAMEWSDEERALKLIYLVGDAPPHMDYPDDVKFADSCKTAAGAGIIVNTIQCGNGQDTTPIWQEIARRAEGEYFAIAQSGGMTSVATPFDERLAELSRQLDGTLVAYGRRDDRQALRAKLALSESIADEADGEALAERASFKAGFAGDDSLTGGGKELVRDFAEGRARLEELKNEELPKELRDKTAEERKAFLEAKGAEREKLRDEIRALSKKRDTFIEAELAKLGEKDAFDSKVLESLRRQAAKLGIEYEAK